MRLFATAIFALALTGLALGVEMPDRLPKAKAGEWVVMQDVSGSGSGGKATITVAEVRGSGTDAVVVLKIDRDGGESRTIEIPMSGHDARRAELLDKAKQISQERMTVKGREFPVTAISWDDTKDDTHREFKLWLSDEIPVMGMVKSWSSDPDVPAGEVVDFGF